MAREMLAAAAANGAACGAELDAVLTRNVQRRDLSKAESWNETGIAEIDLVTMFVVTGVFEDKQLDRVLARVRELAPRYLFVTTVSRRWRLWYGRPNEHEFFERAGFREIRRHWMPEIMPKDSGVALLLPKRYWTNPSARIYRPI
jgi:hypothetical protein